MVNRADEPAGTLESTKGGIQALDAALHMLKVMATFPGPVSLSDLARRAEMPPSKVHRYLASFATAGFVIQRERSGKYDFGPEATKLGLNAVGRVDFVNVASDHLLHLAESTGLTALLTVWGTHGGDSRAMGAHTKPDGHIARSGQHAPAPDIREWSNISRLSARTPDGRFAGTGTRACARDGPQDRRC